MAQPETLGAAGNRESRFANLIDRVNSSNKYCREIIGNARIIADQLVGSEPECEAKGEVNPCRSGQMGAFEDACDDLEGTIADLNAQICRIRDGI